MKAKSVKILALIASILCCVLIFIVLIIPPSFHCRITETAAFDDSNPPLHAPLNQEFVVRAKEETNIYYAGPVFGAPGEGTLDASGKRNKPFIAISKLDYTFEGMYLFFYGDHLVGGKCKKQGFFDPRY